MGKDSFIGHTFHKMDDRKTAFLNVTVHRSEGEKIAGRALSDEEMQKLTDAVAEGLSTHYEDEIEFAAEMLRLRR